MKAKNVLVIEDIIDSGRTLSYLLGESEDKKSEEHSDCVRCLDKPDRRVVDVKVDYVGFEIPDEFVVGYGSRPTTRSTAICRISDVWNLRTEE